MPGCRWIHEVEVEGDGSKLCWMKCLSCGDGDFCWNPTEDHPNGHIDGKCDCPEEDVA